MDVLTFELYMRHLLFFMFLMPMVATAQVPASQVFSFQDLPVSVISAALSGTQISQSRGDVAQLADNPAFLDSSMHQNASLSYLNYVSTINQATLAYGHMDSIGFISGYLRYFDYGTFIERDASGVELGKFKVADYELGVSLTRPYNDRISYGVTFKNLFSAVQRTHAYGLGFDFGGYYVSKDQNFRAGVTLDNVGLQLIDYTGTNVQSLPVSLNMGIAKKFDKAPLILGFQYSDLQRWDLAATDLNAQQDVKVDQLTGEVTRPKFTMDNFLRHLNASVSFVPSEKFSLMAGYSFRRRLELASPTRPALVGFSFGANIKVKRFSLMYAITSYHINGTSNHLGITTNLNEWYSSRTKS